MLQPTTVPEGARPEARQVRDIIDALAQDPASATVALRISTEWLGGMRSQSRAATRSRAGEPVLRDISIVSDHPGGVLGEETAPSPQELLLSAVNSCMVAGYVLQAALRGIQLESCRIETEGEIDLRGFLGMDETMPPGYRRLNYTVSLDGDGTRQQFEEIHEAVMVTSPNFFTLSQPVQMCGRLA